MKPIKTCVTLAALTFVVGCSGGGNNATEVEISDELAAFSDAFGDDIASGTFADLSALPSEGTAHYAGFIGIGEDTGGRDFLLTESTYTSPMDIEIRLNSGELTGQASAFVEVASRASLDGTLTLNGSFNRDADLGREFPISGNITGVLTDGEDRTLDIQGDFVADLYGDGAAGLSGDSNGNLTTRDADGNVIAADTFAYDADVIATRESLDESSD